MNETENIITDKVNKLDTINGISEKTQLVEAIESLSIKNEANIEKLGKVITEASKEEKVLWDLVSYDSILIAFVTILVFGLGFILNHLYQQWLKWNEAKSIRNYFFSWVKLHSEIFGDQINNLKEISENLKKSKELQEEQLKVKSFKIEKLLEIPFLKLMNVYVSNSIGIKEKNEKAFFNLINSLEFLSSFNTRLFQKYEEFTKGTEELRIEWNLYFREFDDLKISVIRSHQNKNTRKWVFANKISKFSSNFFLEKNPKGQYDPKINLEEWVNEYFVPLRDIITKEMSENLNFLDAQMLASKIEEILIVYKKWKAWKDGYSHIFKQFEESMEKTSTNLEAQVDHFNSKRLVKFLVFKSFH